MNPNKLENSLTRATDLLEQILNLVEVSPDNLSSSANLITTVTKSLRDTLKDYREWSKECGQLVGQSTVTQIVIAHLDAVHESFDEHSELIPEPERQRFKEKFFDTLNVRFEQLLRQQNLIETEAA